MTETGDLRHRSREGIGKELRLFRIGLLGWVVVYVAVVIGYAYWSGRKDQIERLQAIDQRLYIAALSLKHMLSDDFHDRAVDAEAISFAEEMKNRKEINSFANETQFTYLYTLAEKDGLFYFSAPTVTEEEARQQRRWYFLPYEDVPEAFRKAFAEGTPQFVEYTDQWGNFRSIALPQTSPGGRRYLSCADYDISYVKGLLRRSHIEAVVIAGLFILLTLPLVLLYRGMYRTHAAGLSAVNEMLSENQRILAQEVAGRTVELEIANQRLKAEITDQKKLESKVHHQNQQLEALHGISLGLIRRLKVDDLLQDIIRQASDLGGTAHTWIYLYDPESEELELKFGRGFYEDKTGYRMKPGQGLTGKVFSTGAPLQIEDYKNWEGRDPNRAFDALSTILGIPLVSGKRRLGVIGLSVLEDGARLDESVIAVMHHFADLAAIAIDNAFLHTELEQELQRRKELEAERMEMEKRLFQAQKNEAIGTLAGGIAHNFNNLLMGIQGRASLMALETEISAQQRHIQAIEEHIQSAAGLTQQLLGYARGGKYEVRPLDLNDLVSSTAVMFGHTRKELRIHTRNQPGPIVVDADRSQMEQVLLNLLVNAWQAMPGGGDLYLQTSTVALDDSICQCYRIRPGSYAEVSVTDTGIGIDEANLEKIFDPFFTTKEETQRTGLGLASADGIVRNHGGIITVTSKVGKGSTFSFYLPLSENDVRRPEDETNELLGGPETILVVDDEEWIREVAAAMLKKLGYEVIEAAGGKEAVDIVAEKGGSIDLVVLDMIMPGMDGGEAFDRIRDNRPHLPVLLSSGYAVDGQAKTILNRGCDGFLQKPYRISVLSQKIRAVLERRRDTPN
ncbi:MAG: response regulator [Desulfobacteraceae bacterium]|nr:response regulator [Desulfobacteraceae bacterium]